MSEIDIIQSQYDKLISSGKITKKDICNLLVPFRDKHGLTDIQTLRIARKELSKTQVNDIMESCAISHSNTVIPYMTACGNVMVNIWWYKQPNNKISILMKAVEYNFEKVVKFTISQLNQGYKALKWLETTQKLNNDDYKRLKQEILINVVNNSDYRLDNLD